MYILAGSMQPQMMSGSGVQGIPGQTPTQAPQWHATTSVLDHLVKARPQDQQTGYGNLVRVQSIGVHWSGGNWRRARQDLLRVTREAAQHGEVWHLDD